LYRYKHHGNITRKKKNMNITKATYGGVDCLEQVKSKIKGETLILRVDNGIIGDTQPGVVKFP